MAGVWGFFRKPSLHRRLAVILLVSALVSTVVSTSLAVVFLFFGRDGWVNQTNLYVAKGIAASIDGEPDPGALRARVAHFQSITEANNREEGLSGDLSEEALQVVGSNQAMAYRSTKAPSRPFPMLGAGVHSIRVDGQAWWIASAPTSDGRHWVHVGSPSRDRMRLFHTIGADVGGSLLLPLLLSCGLALLAVRTGLKPLFRLAATVQDRAAAALDPIEPPVAYEEFQPLLQAINRQFAQARLHLEHQRAFIADAAHELRTPLAVISTQAHRLAFAESADERRLAQADLQIGLESSAKLITQLLTIAQLETPNSGPRKTIDLEALLREIVQALAPVLMGAGCDLGLTSPGPTYLDVDPGGLRSAVENLVRNAGLYAGRGALVDLVLVRQDKDVLIQVMDDGPGVPEIHRSRLSERFYRIPGTPSPGSGLGLAIARKVAEGHGGVLELSSGLAGRGFGATLRLPRHAKGGTPASALR